MLTKPERDSIPIWIAALGDKKSQATAEYADGWLPHLFHPEKADQVWGDALAAGTRQAAGRLGPLQIAAGGMVAIGEGRDQGAARLRPPLFALYVGGMGAKGKNFYNDLACLRLREGGRGDPGPLPDGKKKEAEALVPAEWLEACNLVGPESYVKERIAAFREAGVTHLKVMPGSRRPGRHVAQLKEWVADAPTSRRSSRPSTRTSAAPSRTFFEKEVVPHHDQWEKDGIVPREVWRKAGEPGCSASTSPRSTAAPGVNDFRYNMVVAEESARRRRQRPRLPGPHRHHRPLPHLASAPTSRSSAGCPAASAAR